MSNVLYEPLPDCWEKDGRSYIVNTSFRIGIQLSLLFDDNEITERERQYYLLALLFGNEDGSIREFPQDPDEFMECLDWFIGGWYHDNQTEQTKHNEKVMDYYVDQGRIYADFRHIYSINLNEVDMHWWEFQWLLWNMPDEESSFLSVIKIRTQKPRRKAGKEELEAIRRGKTMYGLKTKRKEKLTREQEKAIDEYDKMMSEYRNKRTKEKEALAQFRKE